MNYYEIIFTFLLWNNFHTFFLQSADVVGEMWQSSGFTWDMFLPSGKDVQDFVNNKVRSIVILDSIRVGM